MGAKKSRMTVRAWRAGRNGYLLTKGFRVSVMQDVLEVCCTTLCLYSVVHLTLCKESGSHDVFLPEKGRGKRKGRKGGRGKEGN